MCQNEISPWLGPEKLTCMMAAGPKYLSLFHQYDGHDVEQQAQRMHS